MTILPQLEHDLFLAASGRLPTIDPTAALNSPDGPHPARSHDPQHRARRVTSGIALLVSVLVVAVIAGTALVALHHRAQPTTRDGAQKETSGRQQLVNSLSVLGRPQTADERTKAADPGIANLPDRLTLLDQDPLRRRTRAQLGFPEADRPLVRIVGTRADGDVWIVPATHQIPPHAQHRAEVLFVSIRNGVAGVGPIDVATLEAHGAGVFAYSPVGINTGIFLVPDPVARVTLSRLHLTGPFAAITPTITINKTAVVHENVAPFQFRLPVEHSPHNTTGLYSVNAQAQLVWRDSAGKPMRHATTAVQLTIRVTGRAPASGSKAGEILNSPFCQQNPSDC
jgi:hypothetical protein